MKFTLYIALFSFILFIALLRYLDIKVLKKGKRRPVDAYSYVPKKYFMTAAERDFFKTLLECIGSEYIVFAQVHLSAVLEHRIKSQNWNAAFSHINQKSVDYVVCDSRLSPLVAIELDDLSHEASDRRSRDTEVEKMLSDAGLPLLRFSHEQDVAIVKTQMLGVLRQSK